MEFIPYQRLTITTDLPKEEVVNRMRGRIGPTRRENFVRVDNNIFSGQLLNDKFELILIRDYRNSFTPEVTGAIVQNGETTELIVTLKSNIVVIVFMIFGLTMVINEIIEFKDTQDFDLETLLPIIIPYGLCWFGFNLDADKSIDGLIKITKGEVK